MEDSLKSPLIKQQTIEETLVTFINNSLIHISIPINPYLTGIALPGVSTYSRTADMVFAASLETLTEDIDLLGARWVAGELLPSIKERFFFKNIVKKSILTMDWDFKTTWVAVPMELKDSSTYYTNCPATEPYKGHIGELEYKPLFKCSNGILLDKYRNICESTFDICPNKLEFAMNRCFMGCKACGTGLGNATAN